MQKFSAILLGSISIILSSFLINNKVSDPVQRFLTYDYELGGPCSGHGGTDGFTTIWNVATCGTNCKERIGFRCGRLKIYKCGDGSVDYEIIPSSCPSKKDRSMEASVLFYDNNTIKLVFKNAMPETEANNHDFEVEDGEEGVNDIPLPVSMLLDGVHYSILRIVPGTYRINYNEGKFGTVIINAELIQ